jgi:hypothetical protein
MNASKLFAFTLLTAVAGAAFAGDGVLIRNGEGSGHYAVPPSMPKSNLSRDVVKATVLRARAEGTLMPAGAALWGSRAMYDTPPSGLPRAEVKAQVLQARANGTLLPAGEAAEAPGRSISGTTSLAGLSR